MFYMTIGIYAGTLYFDDGSNDSITVNRLILRNREVAFHFNATWGGMTMRIEVDGVAVCDGNCYISESIAPRTIEAGFYPVIIKLCVLERCQNTLYVEGFWKTKVADIGFSGDLEGFNK
jgi:hypothetical protein